MLRSNIAVSLGDNDHCLNLLISRKAYILGLNNVKSPNEKKNVHQNVAKENWEDVLNARSVHDKIDSLHARVNNKVNNCFLYVSV